MTKTELTRNFYERVYEGNVETADALAEVLKEFSSEQREKIADDIEEFCKSKGIDTQDPAIVEITNLSENAKFQKWKETVKDITKSAGSFVEKLSPENKGEVVQIQEALNLAFAEIDVFEDTSKVCSFEQYEKDCLNYDSSKEFCLDLFNGLAFPNGTLSYIGARTGRGKTTTLVNIAREALVLRNPRKVVFISLEMSFRQILSKLIVSTAYASSAENLYYPAREIYNVFKGVNVKNEQAENYKSFCESVLAAKEKIGKSMKEDLFLFIDGRGVSERKIINFITAYGQEAAVLIDYVQRIPAKQERGSDTYRRLQIISGDLQNVAAKTNAVIISAAQLNRMSGTETNGDDKFDDASFRESGDIEQDAHNAIGIGWKANKQDRFYQILKTREDARQGKKANIEFIGEYSYMKQGEEIKDEESNQSGQTKNGSNGNVSKKGRRIKKLPQFDNGTL
ncbi:MAG: hypothetical protein LBJ98_02655 [Endomicrobium sp.]|jgi:replicative DNA helicase|nr:hypothetical protein [Endomicrobium sp.]